MTEQFDYVKPGSAEHAAFLGLRKAKEGDAYVQDDWALLDPTAFGPQATEAYIKEVLRQKVSELKSAKHPDSCSVRATWTMHTRSENA